MTDPVTPADDPKRVAAELDAEIGELQQLLDAAIKRVLDEQGRLRATRPFDEARFSACLEARLALQAAESTGRLKLRPFSPLLDDVPRPVGDQLDDYRDHVVLALGALAGIDGAAALVGEDANERLQASVRAFRRWKVQAAWIEATRAPASSSGSQPTSGPAAAPTQPRPKVTLGGLAAAASSLVADLRTSASHLQGIRDELMVLATRHMSVVINDTMAIRSRAERLADRVARRAHEAGDFPNAEDALGTLRGAQSAAALLPSAVEEYHAALNLMTTRLGSLLHGIPEKVPRSARQLVKNLENAQAHHYELLARSRQTLMTISAAVVSGQMSSLVEDLEAGIRG